MKPTRVSTGHLPESERKEIKKVVVLPHTKEAELSVFGTYKEPTADFLEGALVGGGKGAALGADLFFGIPVEVLAPIFIVPAALLNGLRAESKRQIQEFRDSLTKVLLDSADDQLAHMTLAHDVYSTLRVVDLLDANVVAATIFMPSDADATLLVRFAGTVVDVREGSAGITTYVDATLRRVSDGKVYWERTYEYMDQDTLKDWAEDDAALWVNYIQFARHYFSRQITEDLFDRHDLEHMLLPAPNPTVRFDRDSDWSARSKSLKPVLSWELQVTDGSTYPWVAKINPENTYYDLEVYDRHRLVYSASGLSESNHQVTAVLDKCKQYWWTVRPSYRVVVPARKGEWMRLHNSVEYRAGSAGSNASAEPAFLAGFAKLETQCR